MMMMSRVPKPMYMRFLSTAEVAINEMPTFASGQTSSVQATQG